MAGPRAQRLNIPLRRVAILCGVMLFLLLANVSYIQVFQVGRLERDQRNNRTSIARFASPRGQISAADGTVLATSRKVAGLYRYQRVYPSGPLYAAVTGYMSLYRTTGIEAALDPELSGSDPRVKVRALLKDVPDNAAVKLTISPAAQRAAYEGLRASGRAGAVVALDPATGAIKALVSYPSYDPNDYATFDVRELTRADERLQSDPGRPLLNRALAQNYPPGSTFKIVTGAAALESGDYSPSGAVAAPVRLRLPGTSTYLRNSGGESCGDGTPTLAQAFQISCNTAFAGIGVKVGQDRLRSQAEEFGFNDDGLKIPLDVAESVFPSGLDDAQTALSAIGQYNDKATPLQIALISAAVANGGTLMRPYLVQQTRLGDGTILSFADPEEFRDTMSRGVAAEVRAMMVSVAESGGTGTAVAIPGVEVAAKTGTSENEGSDHALFTAFAPAGDPTVAVGVVVEHGGFGGKTAAPIAKAVLQALL